MRGPEPAEPAPDATEPEGPRNRKERRAEAARARAIAKRMSADERRRILAELGLA